MYDLLKGNMHDMYVKAGWAWNKGEKYREMAHRDARFLIAYCDLVDGSGDGDDEDQGQTAVTDTRGGVGTLPMTDEQKCKEDSAATAAVPDNAAGERGRLAGYCHFRFAWDADENDDGEGVGGKEDVLYVYELQVAPWATRRGLGRRMMQVLEVGAR